MSQLPAPGDPVAEKRTDDMVPIAEGRWIRVVAHHRDMRTPVLEDEFLVAVDHTHVSLGALEHVTEGTARAQQKSPQSSERQRQRLSDIDPESFATVSEDRANDGRMLIRRDQRLLAPSTQCWSQRLDIDLDCQISCSCEHRNRGALIDVFGPAPHGRILSKNANPMSTATTDRGRFRR